MNDAGTAGFLLLVIGIGGLIWWARRGRPEREAVYSRLLGG